MSSEERRRTEGLIRDIGSRLTAINDKLDRLDGVPKIISSHGTQLHIQWWAIAAIITGIAAFHSSP